MPYIEHEETVFKDNRFSVVAQTVHTETVTYKQNLVVMGSGVSIVLVDGARNIYLIREWRASLGDYITQIPGGYCGSDEEQALLAAVKQEALEEVGVKNLPDLRKIKTYYPNGGIRNKIHIYLAEHVDEASEPSPEHTEDIAQMKIPLIEAYERFVIGEEVTTGATTIGIALAMHILGEIK